jgi:hypothetical protein
MNACFGVTEETATHLTMACLGNSPPHRFESTDPGYRYEAGGHERSGDSEGSGANADWPFDLFFIANRGHAYSIKSVLQI